jgi:aspartyl-tRNA(Asn)/glutamyl-tRNA(Gln) amidotransferase subunit A
MQTLPACAAALAEGRTSSAALVEAALDRIADPEGEGARAFLRVHADSARQMAAAMDALRRAGRAPGPYAGIPVSLKDLADIAGEPTPGGSRALADAPPAARHATTVARLLAAGLVPVGRTNMTEFAFSGLGINPHHGTPAAPWQRATTRRIPGGSSSGAAVSVADGMAAAALGTDTGGSCRVPAAFCGIVGFKPTARRVPLDGIFPLAPSLDSVGPLANSVGCCAIVDAIFAGTPPAPPVPADLASLRLLVPDNLVLDGMEPAVAEAFAAGLRRLKAAGARLTHARLAPFNELPRVNAAGGFASAEAYAWHRCLLAEKGALFDPRIRARIERGSLQSAADYIDLVRTRAALCRRLDADTAPFDAVVMPSVVILPPPIAALEADEAEYSRINLLVLRNTALANFFDRCAISLPLSRDPPIGLMLMGETFGDARLFAIAAGVEMALS